MSGTFSSRTYNFNTILGRSSFPDYTAKQVKVPAFQRGFSWEKNHVATFWDDIWQFHNSDPGDTYFLGPVVVLPIDDHILVLDGQQRLATATIFLSVLRDLARRKGGQKGSDFARDIQRDNIVVDDDNDVYALTMSDLDKTYFESTIQTDPPADDKPIIRSHRLIKQAKSFISTSLEEKFEGKNSAGLIIELKRMRTTLVERLKIVVIEVGSEEEAYQIFETLNDRGLRLSVPDLLLNFLMRSATTASQREKIREYWNNVVQTTGVRRVNVFLRHMWISRFGDVKSQSLYREIREHLDNKGISSLEFARQCSEECASYSAIVDIEKDTLKSAEQFIRPLVKNLAADKTYPILLSGLNCLMETDFAKLARYTVAIIVRHQLLANLNPSTLEDVLYDVAREIRAGKSNGQTSSKILASAKNKLKTINPTQRTISQGLSDVYLNQSQAQNLLTEIANKMQSPSKALEMGKTSIEHIFPKNAKAADWKNTETLRPYLWHIGNLTLLEPKINKDIGNVSFELKASKYPSSEIEMTKNIPTSYSTWDDAKIEHRAIGLTKFIDQVWVIP